MMYSSAMTADTVSIQNSSKAYSDTEY